MTEIERKFLVKTNGFKAEATTAEFISQGFLNTHPERTVRVRIKGGKGYITVKGISNASGTSRFEWEKEIGLKDAEGLLNLCEASIIEKRRFEIPVGHHVFEVDEFCGMNEGLVIAEIELGTEDEIFEKPDWLGKEVTGDIRYYNSHLSVKPFKSWKEQES
ncbi:MAG: CYTH domain-containing protein [Flavobacteriaceae bacterium]